LGHQSNLEWGRPLEMTAVTMMLLLLMLMLMLVL
jgi:hypothetical protein